MWQMDDTDMQALSGPLGWILVVVLATLFFALWWLAYQLFEWMGLFKDYNDKR